ncbi:hypothetical protein AALP_AAs45875U000100, partial [Arabis alpina]
SIRAMNPQRKPNSLNPRSVSEPVNGASGSMETRVYIRKKRVKLEALELDSA